MYMTVRMSLTVSEPLVFLQERFGGSIYSANASTKPAHYKNKWAWKANANQARAFLEKVVPYLRIKRVEAFIAILFQDQMNKWPNDKVVEIRRYLAAECKAEKRFNV
jgi:hypothetical protein